MTIDDDVIQHFNTDDFYVALDVAHDCNQNAIKRAYLTKSLEFHPDRTSDSSRKDEYNKKFQTITKIYQILSDPSTRAEYDRRYETVACRHQQSEPRISEEISLRDCSEGTSHYSYDCRCSGRFILDRSHIKSDTNCAFIVDCDTCSNSIKIFSQ